MTRWEGTLPNGEASVAASFLTMPGTQHTDTPNADKNQHSAADLEQFM